MQRGSMTSTLSLPPQKLLQLHSVADPVSIPFPPPSAAAKPSRTAELVAQPSHSLWPRASTGRKLHYVRVRKMITRGSSISWRRRAREGRWQRERRRRSVRIVLRRQGGGLWGSWGRAVMGLICWGLFMGSNRLVMFRLCLEEGGRLLYRLT